MLRSAAFAEIWGDAECPRYWSAPSETSPSFPTARSNHPRCFRADEKVKAIHIKLIRLILGRPLAAIGSTIRLVVEREAVCSGDAVGLHQLHVELGPTETPLSRRYAIRSGDGSGLSWLIPEQ